MSLLTYSGITTKVRAMESRLFTEEQFREMAALEDVHSAADYLKQQPAYAGIFSGLDDSMLHRGNIERLLTLSLYRDFASLYRFGSLKQRRFLDLYFMHYEIDIMKRALRHVYSKQPAEMDLSEFREFFEKHSSIDLVALSQSESLEEFLSSLKGSIYYDLLAGLAENGKCSSFDYELQLDLFYFKSLWKIKNKILSKKELKILDECFGSKIDLLNIQWMYRSTQYYHLPGSRYLFSADSHSLPAEAGTDQPDGGGIHKRRISGSSQSDRLRKSGQYLSSEKSGCRWALPPNHGADLQYGRKKKSLFYCYSQFLSFL